MKQLFLIIFALLSFQLFAQTDNKVELTKDEMYADFDAFYRIIKDVNPQLILRHKVTGIDILAELKNMRSDIDSVSYPADFLTLMYNALALCNDLHNDVVTNKETVLAALENDTLRQMRLQNLFAQYSKNFDENFDRHFRPLPLFLDYFRGNYYSTGKLGINTDGTLDSIPQGAKILKIDGCPVDFLLKNNIFPFKFRWDNNLKKQYAIISAGNLIIPKQDTVRIEYEYQNQNHNILFINEISEFKLSGGGYFLYANKQGYVDYFPENEILYICLPRMYDADYYTKKIFEEGKNQSVKKVIIDIRHNAGGADYVWRNILCSIIKQPLDLKAKIGFKNTERALKALDLDLESDSIDTEKIALLDNEEFCILEWGRTLEPSDSTLAFEGKIYVLQDKMIFSSAGSLSNVAKMADNIVSVGEPTGYLLGFGIAPVFFSLPNSGFTFQLEPVIDLSNASNLYDYYHDYVEIPVEISLEQRIKYFNNYSLIQGKGIYSKEFLFNEDPVFQKVLELE
jgi:hypothetical protein